MVTWNFYELVLCFCSGASSATLLLCALSIKKSRCEYRFQKIFAIVLLLHAVCFANNLLIALLKNSNSVDFFNTLAITCDFWLVGGYVMTCIDLIFPKRFTIQQLLLIPTPFFLCTLLFAVSKNDIFYNFSAMISVLMIVCIFFRLKKIVQNYTKMLKSELSDFEHFDLLWTKRTLLFLFVLGLLYNVESFFQKEMFAESKVQLLLVSDTFYCITCCALLFIITRKLVNQQIYSKESINDPPHTYYVNSITENLDTLMREREYFLKKDLSLTSLAQSLGTNRQYISNYITKYKQSSFYEYVNAFRLEKAIETLHKENKKNISIEQLAYDCGFSNYSTFLRHFKRTLNTTPTKYIRHLQKNRNKTNN